MTAFVAFTCSRCTDGNGLPVRLDVVKTTHPGPGVTTRRRRCPACSAVLVTTERAQGNEQPATITAAKKTRLTT